MDVQPPPRQNAAVSSTGATPARGAAPPAASPGAALRGRPFAGILAATFGRRASGKASPGVCAKTLRTRTPASPAGAARGHEAVDAEKGTGGGGGYEGEGDGARRDDARELDLLDPAARHAASLAPPALIAATPVSPAEASEAPLRARSLEELLPALVRRIAWAGDKHRGTVRLELGAGAYAGTTVVVHADAGRVRVEVTGSEGPELDRLRARLDGRLRSHGLDVESVT